MGRPSMLIVPGASALPECYHLLIKGVTERGYAIKALHIPSVGLASGPREGPPASMYDDAAFVASHVGELADAGNDVLLITHSYGGTPATESIRGLSKKERASHGKPGGVVGIAYITSLVPELGQPAGSVQAVLRDEDRVPASVDENGWIHYSDIQGVAAKSFSNMPKEKGEGWARKLVPHSAASFASPLTYPGFKDVLVSYLVCEMDLTIPPRLQRAGIDMMERVSGRKVAVTAIKADHVAPLSSPHDVVEWVTGIAQGLQEA